MPLQPMKGVCHGDKSIPTVVVVCIDHGKGFVNQIRSAQHRMNRAIGLGTPFRGKEAAGQGVILLTGIKDLYLLRQLIPNHGLEGVLHGGTDDKNNLVKPGSHGIINGVFQQNFPIGAHSINLLVAAVTGTKACRHNQ